MSSTDRKWPAPDRCASSKFSQQQIVQLEKWKEDHEEWNVQIVDSVEITTQMIVVELPPYLDIDGLGLNLRGWVIYPASGDNVRVRFWDDYESQYPALESALSDIACLRALKA